MTEKTAMKKSVKSMDRDFGSYSSINFSRESVKSQDID